MNWKVKARIQTAVAMLPDALSYRVYYWMQRKMGQLRHVNPMDKFCLGIEVWKCLFNQGKDPTGKVFFEVGTGWFPFAPLAYWLMGAKKTITIDLNPYLKDELISEGLDWIVAHTHDVQMVFGSLLNIDRWKQLLEFSQNTFTRKAFLELCQIDYRAPSDAAHTGLPSRSVDFHVSCNVLEHIEPAALIRIFQEAKRIIRDDGLFVHRIDYSDHFSYADSEISAVNFLQYSDEIWKIYAGNRYMYMNRMRHDDFEAFYLECGIQVLKTQITRDPKLREALGRSQIHLADRFLRKPPETLAILDAYWVMRAKRNP